MNVDEFAELAAGHALHALSPDDEQAYAAGLAEHPEWVSIADADAATAAALAETTLQVSPPAALRADLLARIAVTAQDHGGADGAPIEPASSRATRSEGGASAEPPLDTAAVLAISRRSWTRGIFALAASLVLLVALGFGAATIGQQLSQTPSVSALAQIKDAADVQSATVAVNSGGSATAYWSTSIGKAAIVSDGLPTISSDQSYELWYLRDGSALSAGVVDAGTGPQVSAVLEGKMQAGDAIAVTVEQVGGSPDGQPTSPPIVVIPTTA